MSGKFGDILTRTSQLLGANATRVAPALLILVAGGMVLDSGLAGEGAEGAVYFAVSMATLAAQYWLTRAALRDLGYGVAHRSRFLAFFGMSVVYTVGVLLGLILVVVPGIILLARWAIGAPALLASGDGVFDCLARSWRETGQHFWPILGVLAAIYLPGWLAFVLFAPGFEVVTVSFGSSAFWLAVGASNLALNAALIAGWYASVAIFTLINPSQRVAEIFE